jgi:hypothetical protein
MHWRMHPKEWVGVMWVDGSGDQEVRLHPLHHLAPSSKDGLHVRPALTTVQDKTAKHGRSDHDRVGTDRPGVPVVIDFFTLDDEHVEECTGLNILWPCLRYGRRSACVHALQPERVRARACVLVDGSLAMAATSAGCVSTHLLLVRPNEPYAKVFDGVLGSERPLSPTTCSLRFWLRPLAMA